MLNPVFCSGSQGTKHAELHSVRGERLQTAAAASSKAGAIPLTWPGIWQGFLAVHSSLIEILEAGNSVL